MATNCFPGYNLGVVLSLIASCMSLTSHCRVTTLELLYRASIAWDSGCADPRPSILRNARDLRREICLLLKLTVLQIAF